MKRILIDDISEIREALPRIERERNLVFRLLRKLRGQVSAPTFKTAAVFVSVLPADRAFPQMAPDGEGGLMMVWDDDEHALILALDENTLLAVEAPGTEKSKHHPAKRLVGDEIPHTLLSMIPPR